METILVIEDDKNIRENVAEMLTLKGYDVIDAVNGKDGVFLAVQCKPNLIICDILMPEMDGYDVLKYIRENRELTNTPFIFLTAKIDRADIRQGMAQGADDYITKPFSSYELLDVIKARLVAKKRMEDEIQNKMHEFYHLMNIADMHEYNTPLNAIIGMAEVLTSNFSRFNEKQMLNLIHYIYISGKRLHKTLYNKVLFNQILTIDDNPADKEALSSGITHNCSTIINDTVIEVAAQRDRSFGINTNIENVSLRISKDNLQKIVEEIVDNAIKFSHSDTEIKISGRVENGYYLLEIEDYGCGMSVAQLEKIAPFNQFDKDKKAQQGHGLGLYLATKLIELNNGKFAITSNELMGTKIEIRLKVFKTE